MKKSILSLTLVLVLVSVAAQVQAFDGDRKGFMLNLGVGAGQAKASVSGSGISVSNSEMGFGGDFKIGGGINSQTVIYYTNRTLFFSTGGSSFVNGMSALGVSYFMEPMSPSFFFSGALGLGVLTSPDAVGSESGVGFTIGAGYEFAPNWVLEGTYMRATVASIGDTDFTISNLMVSVSWFAY